MKILKIIHGFPPQYNAGSEVYSYSIVEQLSKRHEVLVFTREENVFEPDFSIRTEQRERYKVVYVNMPRAKDGYNHMPVNQKFEDLIKELKPDIAIIGHLNHLSTGIVDVLKKYHIPIIYILHDFWLMCARGQLVYNGLTESEPYQVCSGPEPHKCALRCYNRYFTGNKEDYQRDLEYWTQWFVSREKTFRQIAEMVDMFIAPSRFLMKKYIDWGIPESKIKYLDYGFPLHYLRPVKPKTDGVFTFGYIGRHVPTKGINLLIEAFSRIKKPARLKIWGIADGQATKALKLMAQKSYNPIDFCGEYVNQNLATTVFNKVNAIVVPSIWYENSPLVIHEAQACKIPVITADAGGMAEYLQHKVNGLLFKFRDVNSLYEQMLYAIDHPDEMRKLGQRGYLYSEDGSVVDIKTHAMFLLEMCNVQCGNV